MELTGEKRHLFTYNNNNNNNNNNNLISSKGICQTNKGRTKSNSVKHTKDTQGIKQILI